MRQSKAGHKLNPIISAVATPIFERDKVRYGRLCVWIWRQQKEGWPDEAIAETLRLADSRLDCAGDWWRYLTALAAKGKARASENESNSHKCEVGGIASEFVQFLKMKQARE